MKKLLEKYAELLLKRCLNISKNQPLYILAPIEGIEFVRIITAKALEIGVVDIYYDWDDDILKHELLKKLKSNDLINNKFWNKKSMDIYAKKKAAILSLYSKDPDIMCDIDSSKLADISLLSYKSRPLYNDLQLKYDIPWCIAAISTKALAKKVFPNDSNPVKTLWKAIFNCCMIDEEDPIASWNSIIKKNTIICNYLNSLELKSLKITNELGTNVTIYLPDNHQWSGTDKQTPEGKKIIVNMPSLEVFTSPHKDKVNGIVYGSKPFVHNGSIIDNFHIEFKDGKVVNAFAKKGNGVLNDLIKTDATSCYLGEIALVEYNNRIKNNADIYFNTLYDENTSVHLALGGGFRGALKNGSSLSKEELMISGINMSEVHADFMIGTKNTQIIGLNKNDEEIIIFKDGNFYLDEKEMMLQIKRMLSHSL